MMLRGLWLVSAVVLGAWIGGKIGTAISYWFAPEIMRMYLGWAEYLARLPEQLHPQDPVGLFRVVVTSHLVGTLCGALLGLTVYRRIKPRK